MSEIIIGALIGGAIGLMTTALTMLNERKKLKLTLKNEKEIRAFELYEKPKQNALSEYAEALGAVSSLLIDTPEVARYFTAYERVCVFVNQKERDILSAVHKRIMESRMNSFTHYNETMKISFSEEVADARNTIHQLLKPKLESPEE